jgi:hypothetical protein
MSAIPHLVEKTLDSLRPGWRDRQKKKKSIWNLFSVLIAFALWLTFWFYLFEAAWKFHTWIYPEHAGHAKDFWGNGISGQAFASSFLMLIPLLVPAVIAAFVTANCLVWLIPAARRSMDAEAGGDQKMTFKGATLELIKWGVIASIVCLSLSAIGAWTLKSLK